MRDQVRHDGEDGGALVEDWPACFVWAGTRMTFDPKSLQQWWPKPATPKPIVIFGAGSIVGDAHLPAYKKGGFPVVGLFDPNHEKAAALAQQWGIKAFATREEAL